MNTIRRYFLYRRLRALGLCAASAGLLSRLPYGA